MAGNDLKKEAAVIVDPVWSRPTLADDSTEVQLLLIELLAGMIRPSNYWEGGALWMGDQPLDWPQVPKSTQETRSRCCTYKDVRLASFGQVDTWLMNSRVELVNDSRDPGPAYSAILSYWMVVLNTEELKSDLTPKIKQNRCVA